MFRRPFVWEVHVRREVLEEEITQLRDLPYSVWRELLGSALRKQVRGRDNRPYILETAVDWAGADSPDLCVTVTLLSAALRRRLLRHSFVITPDNAFQA